jgi:transposase
MSPVAQEQDIETLRVRALLLEKENASLMLRNAALMKQVNELQGGDAAQLELAVAKTNQQLEALRKKAFGDSSEKKRWKPSSKKHKDKQPQPGHGPRAQPDLPFSKELHELPVAELACDACGGELKEWKEQFEESKEITVVAKQYIYKYHLRQKYRCKCGGCIKTAPGPKKLFPGALYSIDFAIDVAVSKYADHLPLERQVRMMEREGLRIDSQTLWDQLDALAKHLSPAHSALHKYILQQPVIGVDETHWRLMGEMNKREGGKGKRWQAWAVVAPHAVSYQLKPSRSAEAAKSVLCAFSNTLICDGYSAYESLKRQGGAFRVAHCWAHARRKFVELEELHPELSDTVLKDIAELYEVERSIKDASPDERRRIRQQRSKPIIDKIRNWMYGVEALKESPLRKAVQYMAGCWTGLQVFLSDPYVELDNNRTERALRGVVLGRKNHYGSRSERGTQVAALFYSLVESAKLCEVDPRSYLRHAIDAALDGHVIPLPHEMNCDNAAP